MSTQGIRAALKKLASMDNNLLTADPMEMSRYKMGWAPPAWLGNERKEHTKGLWNDGTRTVVFPLIGVIDGERSRLDDYGNLYYDQSKGIPPSKLALAKAKFTLAITYQKAKPGDPAEEVARPVVNQMYCLDQVLENANTALNAAAEDGDRFTTTDWVRFEEIDGRQDGWIHATLGNVYESKVKKIKGRDIKVRAPVQANTGTEISKEDIVNDRQDFLKNTPKHGLKHNESLPCFLPNGDRIGRTPQDLRRELYDGRWVRMDVELCMWNMKAEGKRIFQLNIVRLEVLPIQAVGPEPMFALQDYSSKAPSNVEAGPSGAAQEAGRTGTEGGSDEGAEDPQKDGEADSEGTLSDGSKKANKRVANKQGGRTDVKKLK